MMIYVFIFSHVNCIWFCLVIFQKQIFCELGEGGKLVWYVFQMLLLRGEIGDKFVWVVALGLFQTLFLFTYYANVNNAQFDI